MAFKFVILAALIAVVRGGIVGAPVVAAPAVVAAKVVDATFDPNPQYSFAYDVQDALTGDSKSQVESRNGDIVQGQYTVADPDGTRRIVDYTADPINGFNAVVRRTPLAVAAPVVAAKAVAAPVVAARAFPAPVVAAPARLAAPVVAAPARFALPAPAPLAYAPSPLSVAPGFARLASPYIAAPAAVAAPYAVV